MGGKKIREALELGGRGKQRRGTVLSQTRRKVRFFRHPRKRKRAFRVGRGIRWAN